MNNTLIKLAVEKFDLYALLDENNIDYQLEGKNIGEGYIGIEECPHCGIGNYHYGINVEEKFGTCWSCGLSDDLINLIKSLLGINYYQAKDYLISSVYSEDDIEIQINEIFNGANQPVKVKKEKEIKLPKTVELYKYIGSNKTVTEFCNKRKITKQVAKWLGLQIGVGSKHKNALIVPINHDGDLVGYQARSFTTRYFHNEGPIKQYLYNYNNIKQHSTIFLVEGFTDWTSTNHFITRFRKNKGYYVTSPFSKILTDEQIGLLEEKEPVKVVFMLDYDAWFQYYKPSYSLFCDTDFIIVPKDTDPGQLTTSQFLKSFIENNL